MKITSGGYALIMTMEGLQLDAYQDIGGVWTIGYGRTRNVRPGMQITEKVAKQMLLNDLSAFGGWMRGSLGAAPTSDPQFSAMVSIAYNIGFRAFQTSTVLRCHLRSEYEQAADGFLLWDKVHIDGVLQVVEGLNARRRAERALYLS